MTGWMPLVGIACLTLVGCRESDPAANSDEVVTSPQPAVAVVGNGDAEPGDVTSLGCLPLDGAGWSRSADLVGELEDPVALAARGDAVVVHGRGATYRSSDGLEWEPVADFPSGPDWGWRIGIAGGELGFVAVSSAVRSVASVSPAVAFSPDGSQWDVLDPEVLPTDSVGHLDDVFAGPNGFLIVGTSDGPDQSLLVWHSADGRSWQDADLSGARGGSGVFAVDGQRWVALTTEYPPGGEPTVGVWTSADGLSWAATETVGTPPLDLVDAREGTTPLMVRDDVFVLPRGGGVGGSGRIFPTVWVSTDQGATWTKHSVGGDYRFDGYVLHDAVVVDVGLVLVGRQDDRTGTAGYFLHHSIDGMDWQHCWTNPREFVAVERLGDSVIAYDSTVGDIFVWAEP